MLTHLKNINELTLYAGLSCLVSFLTRLNPVFFFPVLMLRVCILAYCIYIAFAYRKQAAGMVVMAMLLGWLGGYWDLIEVYLHFNSAEFVKNIMLASLIPVLLFTLYLKASHDKP